MKLLEDVKIKSLYNFQVQGTSADGFKIPLTELDEKPEDLDVQIVQIMHDEIILEAKEDVAEKVAGIVKECMEGTLRFFRRCRL